MPFTKHVGEIVSTQQKVVVIFRQMPNDPEHCLVVDTQGLTDDMHNDLMNEVESSQAQSSPDFYNHAHTHFFRDGRPILKTLDDSNKMIRIEIYRTFN